MNAHKNTEGHVLGGLVSGESNQIPTGELAGVSLSFVCSEVKGAKHESESFLSTTSKYSNSNGIFSLCLSLSKYEITDRGMFEQVMDFLADVWPDHAALIVLDRCGD
jgi:hypothetical protein